MENDCLKKGVQGKLVTLTNKFNKKKQMALDSSMAGCIAGISGSQLCTYNHLISFKYKTELPGLRGLVVHASG